MYYPHLFRKYFTSKGKVCYLYGFSPLEHNETHLFSYIYKLFIEKLCIAN